MFKLPFEKFCPWQIVMIFDLAVFPLITYAEMIWSDHWFQIMKVVCRVPALIKLAHRQLVTVDPRFFLSYPLQRAEDDSGMNLTRVRKHLGYWLIVMARNHKLRARFPVLPNIFQNFAVHIIHKMSGGMNNCDFGQIALVSGKFFCGR